MRHKCAINAPAREEAEKLKKLGRWTEAEAGWQMADGGWQMADGGWRMADGGWQMADGRWQMADGRWQMAWSPKDAGRFAFLAFIFLTVSGFVTFFQRPFNTEMAGLVAESWRTWRTWRRKVRKQLKFWGKAGAGGWRQGSGDRDQETGFRRNGQDSVAVNGASCVRAEYTEKTGAAMERKDRKARWR